MNAPARTALAVSLALVAAAAVAFVIVPPAPEPVPERAPAPEAAAAPAAAVAAPADDEAPSRSGAPTKVIVADPSRLRAAATAASAMVAPSGLPVRAAAPGAPVRAALQEARSGLQVGVAELAKALELSDDEVAGLDVLRADAEGALEAVGARLDQKELGDAAARAEIDRIRGRLVDSAIRLLGPGRAEAIRARLGPPTR